MFKINKFDMSEDSELSTFDFDSGIELPNPVHFFLFIFTAFKGIMTCRAGKLPKILGT